MSNPQVVRLAPSSARDTLFVRSYLTSLRRIAFPPCYRVSERWLPRRKSSAVPMQVTHPVVANTHSKRVFANYAPLRLRHGMQ